ncbi:hypothetical protein CCYA_CCYA03G0977 [Cyanidiococcus yangmingshanensis]|nr:hypothetical protein CCYA_CCYA03G0977 [Cyanidiococcus yangmingshanensis]
MSRRERPAFVALVHNVATPRHRQGDFKKLYGSNRLLMSFAERVERSLRKKFPADAIQRVLEAWRQIQRGELLQEDQREAHSYIRGIRSAKFFDCAEFPWVASFEKNWETIRDELWHWESRRQELEQRGSRVWAKAARAEAVAYGPDWRTLVLQDRRWDEDNCKLFSKTNQVIRGSGVPSVEAFFARQAPQSGIKPHSDGCNFILTAHLALSAPPMRSWIAVGGERRFWENGRVLIFDTSYIHETYNESTDSFRYVLLLRFWHPEVTSIEREALEYIFDVLDNPAWVDRDLQDVDTDLDTSVVGDLIERPNRSGRRGTLARQRRSRGSSPAKGFGNFGR